MDYAFSKEEGTYAVPRPKKDEAMTGEIQCVLLDVQPNQNRQMGKQNAAAINMGKRASGWTLPRLRRKRGSK